MQRTEDDKKRKKGRGIKGKKTRRRKKRGKERSEGGMTGKYGGGQQTAGHGRDRSADLVRLMGMGSHSDAIMLLINPLVSACLGG